MLISSTGDSTLRELSVKGEHIAVFAVSLYLGLVATVTKAGSVTDLWDYCTFRHLGCCSHKLSETLGVSFLEPLPLLATLHQPGCVVIWDIGIAENSGFAHYPPVCLVLSRDVEVTCLLSVMEGAKSVLVAGTEAGQIVCQEIGERNVGGAVVSRRDSRLAQSYSPTLRLTVDFSAEQTDLSELDISTLPQCAADTGALTWQAHNESVSALRRIDFVNNPLVVSLPETAAVKVWSLKGELLTAIDIDAAIPQVWRLDPYAHMDRFSRILRGAACIYFSQPHKKEADQRLVNVLSAATPGKVEPTAKKRRAVTLEELAKSCQTQIGRNPPTEETRSFKQLDYIRGRIGPSDEPQPQHDQSEDSGSEEGKEEASDLNPKPEKQEKTAILPQIRSIETNKKYT